MYSKTESKNNLHAKILVTGGCGYIGSHTIVDLLDNGFEVVSIDNNSRSKKITVNRIEKITGKRVKNYAVDLCDKEATRKVFEKEKGIKGIIHFAAYKSVPESVEKPILYYQNNIVSLLHLLELADDYKVHNFVFSSSCSVYGNVKLLPVTEETPLGNPESPYAHTKQIGEEIIEVHAKTSPVRFVMLRYFNPAGAHESALMGEDSTDTVTNLVPRITGTAAGKFKDFTVFGNDYKTRDGSCVRDYIHVMDIAEAHTQALKYLLNHKNQTRYEIFNLGSGEGITVLEAIKSFERVTGKKLNYKIGPRRAGDVISIYANNDKARKILNWKSKRDLDAMFRTAWLWEQKMK